jgi:hypothetical protein
MLQMFARSGRSRKKNTSGSVAAPHEHRDGVRVWRGNLNRSSQFQGGERPILARGIQLGLDAHRRPDGEAQDAQIITREETVEGSSGRLIVVVEGTVERHQSECGGVCQHDEEQPSASVSHGLPGRMREGLTSRDEGRATAEAGSSPVRVGVLQSAPSSGWRRLASSGGANCSIVSLITKALTAYHQSRDRAPVPRRFAPRLCGGGLGSRSGSRSILASA